MRLTFRRGQGGIFTRYSSLIHIVSEECFSFFKNSITVYFLLNMWVFSVVYLSLFSSYCMKFTVCVLSEFSVLSELSLSTDVWLYLLFYQTPCIKMMRQFQVKQTKHPPKILSELLKEMLKWQFSPFLEW